MATKKQTAKGGSVLKPILIISGVTLAVIALFFAWQYAINRPNYRDLKREYSKLSIPSDWKLVSESDNKGVLGLFCWQIEGSECPYAGLQYSATTPPSPAIDNAVISKIVQSGDFQIIETNNNHCVVETDNYYCSVSAKKNKMSLDVSIGVENANKILRIHLGQYAQ